MEAQNYNLTPQQKSAKMPPMSKQERRGGSHPIKRAKVRGGISSKRGVRVIDLSVTEEGQRTDPTAPIDPDKSIKEMREIAELGERAWNEHRGKTRQRYA